MHPFFLKYTRQFAKLCILWLVLIAAGTAFADDSKISPDLKPLLANPANNIQVIVQYNAPSQQTSSGGGLLGGLLGGVGGLVGGLVGIIVDLAGGLLSLVFSLIPAVSAILNPSQIVAVSNQSGVSYISLDRQVNATLDYSAAAINAPTAWASGLEGTGVGIDVIHSGIHNHP